MNKLLKSLGMKYEFTHFINSLTPYQVKRLGREASYRLEVMIRIYIPAGEKIYKYSSQWASYESNVYKYNVIVYV